jgi:N-acetyl sugar amidotransferase
MTTRPYQMCIRCVMDTSDPDITFDEYGVCNHCRSYEQIVRQLVLPEAERKVALDHLVEDIKKAGQGKEYDCVIGVSGGVDSTYVAYLVKQLGLRPLAVHMDNGWDSELAVSNIEKFLKKLGIDLYTRVLDWEEFKDLQLAFLKASVPDGEIPTDHAIWSVLYETCASHNIRYLIGGFNVATEVTLPRRWAYGHYDWRYIQSIYRAYGTRPLKTFPHMNYFKMVYYYSRIKGIKLVSILDYIDYNKEEAMRVLTEELEWRPYGGKHYESIYTRFFQGYILPKKFNIDKRRLHLSTLIWAGQLTRPQALDEVSHPPYAGYMLEDDMEFVMKKFGFTPEEFERIMALPPRSYQEFPNNLPYAEFTRRLRLGTRLREIRQRFSH